MYEIVFVLQKQFPRKHQHNSNRLRATGTLRKNHYRGSRVLEDRLADCLILRHGFSGNL